MAVVYFNSCGHDYDTDTGDQEWTVWDSGIVSTDLIYGYVVSGDGTPFTGPMMAVPGGSISAGILNVTMKMNTSGFCRILLVDDAAIVMDTLGRLTYRGNTSPPVSSPSAWHTYEIKTASGTGTGTLEVRIDGNPIPFWSLTGLTSGDWAGVDFRSNGIGAAPMATMVIQDLTGSAPANDYMGELKPFVLFPVSDIGTPQWTNDFGGPNYAQVDRRVPPGDAHFVHSDTPGDVDEYGIGSLPGDAVSVVSVAGKINARKYAGGTRTLGFILDDGVTQHIGADQAIASGSYEEYIELFNENPITGLPWTLGDFTGLRIGMAVKS